MREPSDDEPISEAAFMEEEEEEEWVRRLLALHPALDEEEARWLYQRERSQREVATDGG